ncbi:hypothetical protein LCGC14_0811050 [marine sediment metagenome]|uniref:Uncharacterized protein n=1 Tax=marine sediment metagenome TaxID=412755 RepID=A0A0F9PR81_9ZZZZ
MSVTAEYYACEQDGIDHNFKTIDLTINKVKYPNVLMCKRCASVFDIGGYKVGIDQLAGMDLNQFKMKEATKTYQAVLHAKNMAAASRSTSRQDGNFQRLLDTLLTEEEETKKIPPRSIWRMDSK